MTNSSEHAVSNPYVGPRTFTEKEGRFFFGREREARDLTARIVSERLLLFYAQSGAGKSSLLNVRVIPKLRDEERFQVLPVGRVSGELPAGVAQVNNIYAFNLIISLDQSDADPARLAQVTLSDFLARLARETAVNDDGQRVARWVYRPELAAEQAAADPQATGGPRFALVIDQFEEIITVHPGRWREREAFFRQLNQALLDDPNLWMVLALREDYVAALDPYAELTFNRLRARFYMERIQVSNGLEAVRRPAELGGRPFAQGVAEQLVDELRQVRVPGRDDTIPGQYVEPVQLQVVCYQLWERLVRGADGTEATPISFDDLAEAGDVNQALEQFYAETLAAVLAEKGVHEAGVSERGLRTWFDRELITETGIRNTVFRNEAAGCTGSMPNAAVDALVRRFLLRTELRGGGAWVELVHDRFVEPIRVSNAAWFPLHLSALQRQAALWDEQGRSSGLLLRDEALAEAEAWAAGHADELVSHEQDFLTACREVHEAAERERRQGRRIQMLAVVAVAITILAIGAALFALSKTKEARENAALATENADLATESAALAEARITKMGQLIGDLGIERLLSMARELDAAGDSRGATKFLQTVVNLNPALLTDLDADKLDADSYKLLASVSWFDDNGGDYVFVPAGTFTMGSDDADTEASGNEKPAQVIDLPGYWIGRAEVTNRQYAAFVEATGQLAPLDWEGGTVPAGKGNVPVVNVSWSDAVAFTAWLSEESGQAFRLPTEAEWEKACRGTSGFIYPWGNTFDGTKANTYVEGSHGTTSVRSYSSVGGDSPYGAADMVGNVSEWTSSEYTIYPYDATDGRENLNSEVYRVLRGGSFGSEPSNVRCAVRIRSLPGQVYSNRGFRVVSASPSVSGS